MIIFLIQNKIKFFDPPHITRALPPYPTQPPIPTKKRDLYFPDSSYK